MAGGVLELTRACHEDLERCQRAIVMILQQEPKNHKESVNQNHLINALLDRIVSTSNKLAEIYDDSDGTRKDEITTITGASPATFSIFYNERLRELKEYHHKFAVSIERPETIIEDLAQTSVPQFTGEEGYGKYLDLHQLHTSYINLKKQHIDYITYLDTFCKFEHETVKKNKAYQKYLEDLLAYIVSFYKRAQPLFPINDILTRLDENLLQQMKGTPAADGIKAEAPKPKSVPVSSSLEGVDDDEPQPEPQPVAPTAADKKDKPVYCDACEKAFAKQTVYNAHLTGKKHIKAAQAKAKATQVKTENGESSNDNIKKYNFNDIVSLEYKINMLGQLLERTIQDTRANVEKRQSKTPEELEMEAEEEEAEVEAESEEEEEEVRQSIPNYPVGWDGKPIPYWLYKLHGLGIEYKCEICGNQSYWGRRAFERHFQEWRHAHGMRCLGIPNTRHFHEITSIADAQELYKKIKVETQTQIWKPDAEEEFEDSSGNVFNKKTFDDLKRQGLIA